MSFDWAHYLTLSQSLFEQGRESADEAKLRCSISRAYYAAFGKARDFLENEGEKFSQESVHQKVAEIFNRYEDEDRREVGDYLIRMRNKRNRADYDSVYQRSNPAADASDVIFEAECLIETLQRIAHGKNETHTSL